MVAACALRGEREGKIKQTNTCMERNARETQEGGVNEEERREAEGLYVYARAEDGEELGFALSIKVSKTVKDRDREMKRGASERRARSREREGSKEIEKEREGKTRKEKEERRERERKREVREGERERERDVSRTPKERVGKRKSRTTGAHRSVLGASCYWCTSAPPFSRR